jgi:trehalose 6-phosphate synthase
MTITESEDGAAAPQSAGGPLVVVSHRGPLQFSRDGDRRVASRGSGGLVTAFAGLGAQVAEAVWICAAIGDEDVAVARERGPGPFQCSEAGDWWLRMIELDADRHHQFYNMIANPLLWFVQHRLWDLSDAPDIGPAEHAAWRDGYVWVNRAFADAVLQQIVGVDAPSVLVQDYHLYLVPGLVRARSDSAFISFFCHIPWPQPDAWRVLPQAWRRAIFEGLLGADIVGFHTEAYARNFVAGCGDILDLEVDLRRLEVRYDGRQVAARWYPISVDTDQLAAQAATPAVVEREEELRGGRREHMILRVDRTDLSKNILRGFRAFGLMLERHPEMRERVTFLALLQPSRQDVHEYALYLERIRRTVADLNLAHGTADWQPVDLRFVDDIDLAIAAYKQFDVLVVNSIADGMNLVAKEGMIVSERNGVLLLSENTGAHAELGHFAVSVNPFDIEQQAEAMWAALTMEPAERRARRQACADIVKRNDLRRWLRVQLDDRERAIG